MGFSLRRMFRHPFGGHSLFHAATHNPLLGIVGGVLMPPLAGLTAVSKVKGMVRGGEAVFRQVRGAFALGKHLVAPNMPNSAAPGGPPVSGASPLHVKRKRHRKAKGKKRHR